MTTLALMTACSLVSPASGQWLDLRVQAQVTALVSMPDASQFGGVEIQGAVSLFGVGIAAGLGFDHIPFDDGEVGTGGHVDLTLQWRFVAMLDKQAFHFVDPHLDVGGVLGAIGREGEAEFLGALYLGAGLDVGLFASGDDPHPVLTVQYRYQPLRGPSDQSAHLLLVGLGARVAD